MTARSYLSPLVAAAFAFSLLTPAFAQAPQPVAPQPGKIAPAPALKPAPAAEPLDINTASEAELDALPGVGAVRAAAIIKGRPYKGKDELWQKKILPKGVYNKIKDQIIAHQH